jgi:hypothetical protein
MKMARMCLTISCRNRLFLAISYKLPQNDYILTLSATTPTGETEEINRYIFRVLRK